MTDYIDACIFLATIFGEDTRCTAFLNRVGYKQHPAGTISHYVISELFINILKKRKGEARIRLFGTATRLLSKITDFRRFTILKLFRDETLFEDIKQQDYTVTDDDAFHLVAAITGNCDRFMTIDNGLLGSERLKNWLKREHSLKLTHP